MGLRHSEGAVGRFWRAEVLGSTVTPGAGGTVKKKSRKSRNTEVATTGVGALAKQDVAKMLSKTLKVLINVLTRLVYANRRASTYSSPSRVKSKL